MDGNIERTRRPARAYVVLADDRAHEEILEFLRGKAFIVYARTASSPAKRLVVKEEAF